MFDWNFHIHILYMHLRTNKIRVIPVFSYFRWPTIIKFIVFPLIAISADHSRHKTIQKSTKSISSGNDFLQENFTTTFEETKL
jgi:hypothetical protein